MAEILIVEDNTALRTEMQKHLEGKGHSITCASDGVEGYETLKSIPFDVIILDGFCSDAIPVHLLTREAMAIYLDKLKPGGVLAVHVSNLYLDLKPVVAALAGSADCVCIARDDLDLTDADRRAGKSASQWVVVARSATDLQSLVADPRWRRLAPSSADLWTDDFSNLLRVFRWR